MYDATLEEFDEIDVGIACAAVADYRIKEYSTSKIKKKDGDLVFELTRNPDILLEMGKRKKEDQKLIGFAAESDNLVENATKKLNKKNLDFIVANSTAAFGNDSNQVLFISQNDTVKVPQMKKEDLAFKILENLK
jgi:phosphopantothenoylcysteine decarboxylase/phosphopantothenate--cysteine ligase